MKKDKNAKMVMQTIIFILLNLVFFTVMLIFAYSSGNREFVYEQTLAKEIALIIDNANPEMIILLDLNKFIEIAEDNNQPIDKIIKIDNEKNLVEVKLKEKGGYSYQYFSDYDISSKIEQNMLLINIKRNE